MRLIHRLTLAAVLVLLTSSASFGYTLFLKDGSQVLCQKPYEVREDRAIVVLESGQTTTYRLRDIDIERTQRFNETSSGSAVVIDGGEVRAVPRVSKTAADRDLQDLIRERRSTGTRTARPPARRQNQQVRRTRAGYLDLSSVQRRPLDDRETSDAIDLWLRKTGVGSFKIFEGTSEGSVFLEITASSRDTVYEVLTSVASTLQAVAPAHGVAQIELLMQTSSRGRAGQFVITPADAAALASGSLLPAEYYVESVQF